MADKLATLARLRRLQAEAAKRDLADATAATRAAADTVAQAEDATAREGRVDDTPGAFAAWLPRAAQAIIAARAALANSEQHQQTARAAFAERRAAEKSVETLLEQRDAKARALAERRAEHALGDLYRPRNAK